MTYFEIIVAADERGGIGKAGSLPWHLPGDMAHFRRLTSRTPSTELRNAVVMGRVTWDSIPLEYRPLRRRLNVVVTRNAELEVDPGVVLADSLSGALTQASAAPNSHRVFLIGGGTLYRDGLPMSGCRRIHLTRVEGDFKCDVFFPELGEAFERISCSEARSDNDIRYWFEVYERVLESTGI